MLDRQNDPLTIQEITKVQDYTHSGRNILFPVLRIIIFGDETGVMFPKCFTQDFRLNNNNEIF